MKKLMIMALVAASAVAANAYTAKWGSGTMKIPAAGTPATDETAEQSSAATTKITAYFWYLGSDTAAQTLMNSIVSDLASNYESTTKSIYEGEYSGLASISKATSSGKTSYGKKDFSQTVDAGTHYGVVLYTHEGTDADKTTWLIANAGSVDISTANNNVSNLGIYQTNVGGSRGTTAMEWVAFSTVPEPTSGLLLLLGMAGLALRRRRA